MMCRGEITEQSGENIEKENLIMKYDDINSKLEFETSSWILLYLPVLKSSKQATEWPFDSNLLQSVEPIKPAPPVTKNLII